MTISGFVAYVKQMWKNKPDRSTPVTAERLLHIEEGIKGNSDAVEKIAAAVISQIINDPEKIASMAALFAVNEKVTQQGEQLAKLNSDVNNISHLQNYFYNAEDEQYNIDEQKSVGTYIIGNATTGTKPGLGILDVRKRYNATLQIAILYNGGIKCRTFDIGAWSKWI